MPDDELLRTLRTLTETADRFEKAAPRHRRIDAERRALQEAVTAAQLFLSVHQQRPLAEVKRLHPQAKTSALRSRSKRNLK
jgi:hypothetical protein